MRYDVATTYTYKHLSYVRNEKKNINHQKKTQGTMSYIIKLIIVTNHKNMTKLEKHKKNSKQIKNKNITPHGGQNRK